MDLNVRLSGSLSLLVSLRALSFEIFSFAFFEAHNTRTDSRKDGRTVLEQSIQVFFRIVARVLYYVHACTGVVLGFRFKSFLSRKKMKLYKHVRYTQVFLLL